MGNANVNHRNNINSNMLFDNSSMEKSRKILTIDCNFNGNLVHFWFESVQFRLLSLGCSTTKLAEYSATILSTATEGSSFVQSRLRLRMSAPRTLCQESDGQFQGIAFDTSGDICSTSLPFVNTLLHRREHLSSRPRHL